MPFAERQYFFGLTPPRFTRGWDPHKGLLPGGKFPTTGRLVVGNPQDNHYPFSHILSVSHGDRPFDFHHIPEEHGLLYLEQDGEMMRRENHSVY